MVELTWSEYIERMRLRDRPDAEPTRLAPTTPAAQPHAKASPHDQGSLELAITHLGGRGRNLPHPEIPADVRQLLEDIGAESAPGIASWRAGRDLLEGRTARDQDFRCLLMSSPLPLALVDLAVEAGAAENGDAFDCEYLAARLGGTAKDPNWFAADWQQALSVSQAMAGIREGNLSSLTDLAPLLESTEWVAALMGWDRETVSADFAATVLVHEGLWPAVASGLGSPTPETVAPAADASPVFTAWWVLASARHLLRVLRFEEAADLVERHRDRWRGTEWAAAGYSMQVVAMAAANRVGHALELARAAIADPGLSVRAKSWLGSSIEVLSAEDNDTSTVSIVSPYVRLGSTEGSANWADDYARLVVARTDDNEGLQDLLDGARDVREVEAGLSEYLRLIELADPIGGGVPWHLPALGTDMQAELDRLVKPAAVEAQALLARLHQHDANRK